MKFRNWVPRLAIATALIGTGANASTTLFFPPIVGSQQAANVAVQCMVTPGATGCPEVKDSVFRAQIRWAGENQGWAQNPGTSPFRFYTGFGGQSNATPLAVFYRTAQQDVSGLTANQNNAYAIEFGGYHVGYFLNSWASSEGMLAGGGYGGPNIAYQAITCNRFGDCLNGKAPFQDATSRFWVYIDEFEVKTSVTYPGSGTKTGGSQPETVYAAGQVNLAVYFVDRNNTQLQLNIGLYDSFGTTNMALGFPMCDPSQQTYYFGVGFLAGSSAYLSDGGLGFLAASSGTNYLVPRRPLSIVIEPEKFRDIIAEINRARSNPPAGSNMASCSQLSALDPDPASYNLVSVAMIGEVNLPDNYAFSSGAYPRHALGFSTYGLAAYTEASIPANPQVSLVRTSPRAHTVPGESFTLHWHATGAQDCRLTKRINTGNPTALPWYPLGSFDGSFSPSPVLGGAHEFYYTCNSGPGWARASLLHGVTGANLTQSKTTTLANEPFDLDWVAMYANDCRFEKSLNGAPFAPLAWYSGALTGTHELALPRLGTHVYRLTCRDERGLDGAPATLTHTVQ